MALHLNQSCLKLLKMLITLLSIFMLQKIYAVYLQVDLINTPTREEYQTIIKPIVSSSRFQFMGAPSSSAGKIIPVGISAGLGVNYYSVPESARATLLKYVDSQRTFPDFLVVPRVIAKAGLPFGLDLGINYIKFSEISLTLVGFGAQYIFMQAKALPIQLAARFGYTKTSITNFFDANSTNFELGAAFSLLFAKAYASIGNQWASSKTNINTIVGGNNISINQSTSWSEIYTTLGVEFSFLLNLGAEIQISPSQTLYNAKIAIEI